MKKLISRRPSPAMVIALVALFVAMGGTGYAAIKITGTNVKNSSLTGTDIKNSSLTGKDVKNSGLTGSDVKKNSLTGSDVAESKLGKVPSAGTADSATSASSATSAGNAGTVGGHRIVKIDFRPGNSGALRTNILNFNGLVMTADCDGTNVTSVNVDTTVADSAVWFTDNRDFGTPNYGADENFDPGDNINMTTGKTPRNMGGEIRYIGPGGRVVTVQWGATALPGGNCNVYGTAIG